MANISLVTAGKIELEELNVADGFIAGEDLDACAAVRIHTNGRVVKASAAASGTADAYGLTTRKVNAGEPITVLRTGILVGLDLDGLDYGDFVFLSDTAGRIADAAGAVACFIGRVIPFYGNNSATPDKALRVNVQNAPEIVINEAVDKVIADPGDAGAIPVTDSGNVQIVTEGAETRTLAEPSRAGMELLLSMKADGGDCVITVATGVNQTGNDTITMNDAGDSIRLNAVQVGADLRWRVVYNDGCTLSTA